ncbi:MAG: hypothetical protein RL514_1807 [Verrucomicrobiota bacterium]|jgi:hypothetical protein
MRLVRTHAPLRFPLAAMEPGRAVRGCGEADQQVGPTNFMGRP